MLLRTIMEDPCQNQQADLPAHPKGLLAKAWVSANLQHSGGSLQGEDDSYMPITKAKSPTLQPILLGKKLIKVALMKVGCSLGKGKKQVWFSRAMPQMLQEMRLVQDQPASGNSPYQL